MTYRASIVVCTLLAACADTTSLPSSAVDSPLEGTAADNVANSACTADPTVAEVAFGADTELGFSAADVLAFAAGNHRTALTWSEGEALDLTPETGAHWLQVAIEPRGARARIVDPRSDVIGHGLVCQSWMEIDVTITLQSDAHALDDRIEATLYTQSPYVAFARAVAIGAQLGGKLAVRNHASADYEPASLGLSLNISESDVSGQLSGLWLTHATDFHSPATQEIELATIGPTSCNAFQYAVGLDSDVDGVRPQRMLDRVAALDPLIAWSDGVETSMVLKFDAEHGACVTDYRNLREPDRRMLVHGTLALRSADGRLMGSYRANVGPSLDEPGPDALIGVGIASIDEPGPELITPAQLGFPMQSREGLDDLQLTFYITLDANDRVDGKVELVGHKYEPCVDDVSATCESIPTTLELGTVR